MDVDSATAGDSEAMSPEVSSTEVKKLKQARLPFSPLEEKKQKKRRSSIGDKNPKASKIVCKTAKIIEQIDLDNIEITENTKIGSLDSSGITKEEKENISKNKNQLPLIKQTALINSPICKKYEADSSSLDSDSMGCTKSTKVVQESVKRRSKKVSNNSPSIASLFKKITDKKEVTVGEVVQLSDDEEPRKKKVKLQEDCDSANASVLDSSSLEEKSVLNDTSSKNSSNNSSILEEKFLTENLKNISTAETPNLKSPAAVNLNKSLTKTPKQIQREAERKLKQEEKDKIMAEKQKEKLDQKLQREKEKQSKKDEIQKLKDERMKRKQEELDAKTKEKEDKRIKKEEEMEEKRLRKEEELEEKRVKKEEKQKKEQDKLKQEELKKLAEDEEIEKQQKLKQKFVQFFVTKKGDNSPSPQPVKDEKDSSGPFMMFRVKGNMKLAPLVRRNFSGEVKLSFDELFKENKCKTNYLKELKQPNYKKRKSFRTLPVQEKVEDCEIIEEDFDVNNGLSEEETMKHRVRAKLLLFCENRRPAYYGTWSKTSDKISGRTPFVKETHFFDYDYDSDDDWEEEETGESLSDSEGEEEEENDPAENNYEEDNVFFVPHGYLSDDEGQDEDDLEDSSKDEGKNDGEQQKLILKKKQEEFEIEMKQKMKPLKPKVYGCVWLHDEKSHQAYSQLVKIFTNYKAVNILGGEYPIGTTAGGDNVPHDTKDVKVNDDDEENNSTSKFCKNFPESAVPDLIRLMHGNRHGKVFLIKEFTEHVKKHNNPEETNLSPLTPSREIIAKKKIEQKIQSLGQYIKSSEIGLNFKNRCWAVAKEIREKYNLGDLPPENSWNYYLPPRDFAPEPPKEEEVMEETPKSKATPGLITKFTKVLTDQEKVEKMKTVATPTDKGDAAKAEIVTVTKTPAADVTPVTIPTKKTPKSTKCKAVVKNIEKFFAKTSATKTAVNSESNMAVDCIELD